MIMEIEANYCIIGEEMRKATKLQQKPLFEPDFESDNMPGV